MLACELCQALASIPDKPLNALGFRFRLANASTALFQKLFQRSDLRTNIVPFSLQNTYIIDRKTQAELIELSRQILICCRFLRFALKRTQLARNFVHDILDALKMLFHLLNAALAFQLALLVLQNACGLFNKSTTVFGLRLQNGVKITLRNNGIRSCAQTGVVKDVQNIHAARCRPIDQVFAFAAAIHAARNGNFRVIHGKRPIGVIQHQVNLGNANRFTRR